MSQRDTLNSPLSRRSWLVLSAASLAACGGGGSSGPTAGLPGTGGTGIYVQGSISGFGSVILNGIKFDDTAASVQIDGQSLRPSDLRLGMVASVQGERGAVLTLGTANSIEVWSIAQGLPAALVPSVTGAFKVAGMTVQTNSATVFDGISSVAALLSSDQRVSVWGLQSGADGTHWTATRVALLPTTATTTVSTGLISLSGAQRSLNGLQLTGSLASTLSSGDLVRVKGTVSTTGSSLALASVQLLDLGVHPTSEVEIEGVVTSTPSTSGFTLGNVQVSITGSTTYSPVGAQTQVVKDARVEVYGTWQGGVLKATKVEIESESSLHEVEIEAVIEQYTSVADFVVRGQRCDASGLTLSARTLSGLKVGSKVHLKGTKEGELLRVTELVLAD